MHCQVLIFESNAPFYCPNREFHQIQMRMRRQIGSPRDSLSDFMLTKYSWIFLTDEPLQFPIE